LRKFIVTALVCAVLAVLPAAAFSDVTDRDAALAAETLQSLDIISGFPDGSYRPGSPLTRAQFAKIAVIALGDESQVVLQKSFTVFPDVLSSHWAAGYVNVAVRHSKILNGYPDGSFAPDKSITEAEAVTICLRMLGYDVEDVGLFWPTDYINKAAEIGLTDGLVITANNPMTRGRAAILIANMLAMDEKEGKVFATRIGASAQEDVTLLAAPATDLSMAAGTVRVSIGGTKSTLYSNKDIPGSQVGRRGVLLTGKDGKVAGFVPYRYQDVAVTIKAADKDGITVLSGGRYLIPISTQVVVGGSLEEFETAWSDLRSGTGVLLHYNSDGVLEYISMGFAATGDSVHVLKNSYRSNDNPLLDFFSDDVVKNATIVKNGATVTAAALRQYDTVSYNADTRIITVSDMKLTGGLEAAYPTKTSVQQVTVFGHSFTLIDGYTPNLSDYDENANITLLLTADGRVAEIKKFTEVTATAYGRLESGSSTAATVVLTNGITLTAKPTNDCSDIEGYFVAVTAGGGGKMNVKAIDMNSGISPSFSVGSMKLGSMTVSPAAALYERVSKTGPVVRIDLADLGGSSTEISGKKIYHYIQDSSGQVVAIIFSNITGDMFNYGKIKVEPVKNEEGEEVSRSITIRYRGLDGSYTSATGTDARLMGIMGPYAGVYYMGDKVGAVASLNHLGTVKVTDFMGEKQVMVGSRTVSIADNVYVCYDSNGEETTLAKLKNACSSFKIYVDRTVDEGGIVRVIVGIK